jgi:dihydroflavonol-4-reductase
MNLIDVRDVAIGHILAADRGRIGERYILGGETVPMSRLLEMLTGFTGLAMPRTRVPYLLALGIAGVSEWIADHVSRKSPRASLAGVQIAGASVICNISKAAGELGFKPRPVHEALGAEIAWLYEQGFIHRPLATPVLQELRSYHRA